MENLSAPKLVKVLIVEDEPAQMQLTRQALESHGTFQLSFAENAQIAFQRLSEDVPDLVLMDLGLPDADGLDVCRRLKEDERFRWLPVIMLTGRSTIVDKITGLEVGADDYLTKPFDDTELLNAIETRLRRTEMFRQYDSSPEGLDAFMKDAGQVLNLKDLGKDKKVKTFKKKMEIFAEGDSPTHVYLVKSGNVKVFKSHPDGKELITNLYKANDYFGFESILENSLYKESASAMEDSEVVVIPKHDFLALLHSNAEVSRVFISLLCQKVKEKESQLLNLAYNSVRQRTAEALLKVFHLKDSDQKLSVSRDDLAKMVGTASESVIRVLSDFKDEGLIDIESGKIKILAPNKLENVIRWNVAR